MDSNTVVTLTASAWLVLIALGGLMGMLGQGIRVIVGLKKAQDLAHQQGKTLAEKFEPSTLLVSLLIGFIAGALASLALSKVNETISPQLLIGFMGAGYAGTDFIEGFIRKYLPGQTPEEPRGEAAAAPQMEAHPAVGPT